MINGVTIGVPVFNDGNFLAQAVASAAPQCERLIISDNCSTDKTSRVCDMLLDQFSNVSVIKQQRNIGALDNFRVLLDMAETPYFMWLGAHDFVSEGYCGELVGRLNADPGIALACPIAHWVAPSGELLWRHEYNLFDKLSSDNNLTRVLALVEHLTDCSIFHGLFRTSILRKSWVHEPWLGVDALVLCNAAVLGKLFLSSQAVYFRRKIRQGYDAKAQLQRLDPNNRTSSRFEPAAAYQYRCIRSLALNQPAFIRYTSLFKARLALVKKYGRFGDVPIDVVVNGILCTGMSSVRKVRNSFRK